MINLQKIIQSAQAAAKVQRSFSIQGSIIGLTLVFQTVTFWAMQAGFAESLGWMGPVVGQWIAQVWLLGNFFGVDYLVKQIISS